MKTAEDIGYEITEKVDGMIRAIGGTIMDGDGIARMFGKMIQSRDAEIHALYAPVVEALRELVDAIEPTPLLTQHCALRKARTALAAIKEVKGDA